MLLMAINRSLLAIVTVGFATTVMTSACQKKAGLPEGQNGQKVEAGQSFPDAGGEAPAPQAKVDQKAVQAIQSMSKYLSSFPKLQWATTGTMDVVTADGQRIQMDGSATYQVKRPGFVIKYVSDAKSRNFYYDGKQFTIYSPTAGFFATVPAPATNREVFDTVYNRYGIRLPLEDLFRWNDSNEQRIENFRAAYDLGTVTLDGVKTTHYAFREPDVDWEIWIQDGDKPLPLKLSIVDRTDPARPAFTTRIKWTPNPTFADRDFTFVPGKGAMKIGLAQFKG
jgi:hypothetical protein